MNGIKEIREMLGLSQSELAQHLGISRSQLSMAEINRRMLPVEILLKIAELQVGFNSSTDKNTEPLTNVARFEDKEFLDGSLAAKEYQYRYKLDELNDKLNAMIKQHEHLFKCLQCIENVLANKTEDSESYDFLVLQRQKLRVKISSCNPVKQDELRLKIKILEMSF